MGKSKGKGKGSGNTLEPIRIDKDISPTQIEELLSTLETRFESNMRRHEAITWADVQARLLANDEKLATLHAMETTGGEPDVIGHNADTGEYIFCDCSAESPTGRRSICYDGDAEAERHKKKVYPAGNAVDIAAAIGVDLLTERQYRSLQQLGDFDLKTSSWVQTPPEIRERGGALFCDRRYDHVFTYHNGAPSFYAARGFRGLLRV